MRKILYWSGYSGKIKLIDHEPVQAAVHKLLTRDYNHNDLEKLKTNSNFPIYSFRINIVERLIFTTKESKLYLLDYLPKHGYHKSQFLKRSGLNRYLANQSARPSLATETDHDNTTDISSLTQKEIDELNQDLLSISSDTSSLSSSYSACDYFNQNLILMNEEQSEILVQGALPHIVNGPAGVGKSYLSLLILRDQLEKMMARGELSSEFRLLYVTKEDSLKRALQSDWFAMAPEAFIPYVDFLTYDDLLPNDKSIVIAQNAVHHWLSMTSSHLLGQYDHANPHWLLQQFRICCGFQKVDYMNLGEKQCGIAVSNRSEFYELYLRFIRNLDSDIISDFFPFQLNRPPYPFIVVDEAHNLSLMQLNNLRKLSFNQQIVYCMDGHQALEDAYPVRPLLEQIFFLENTHIKTTNLKTTHRLPKALANFVNELIRIKLFIIGGKGDKFDASEMIAFEDRFSDIIIQDDSRTKPTCLPENMGTHIAVVTCPQYIEEARNLFSTNLVFSPQQIQGLEFEVIVVFNLIDNGFAKSLYKPLKDMPEEYTPKHRSKSNLSIAAQGMIPSFNELYITLTRAKRTIIMIQDSTRENRVLMDRLRRYTTQIKIQVEDKNNSLEAWERQLNILTTQGDKTATQAEAVTEQLKITRKWENAIEKENVDELILMLRSKKTLIKWINPFYISNANEAHSACSLAFMWISDELTQALTLHPKVNSFDDLAVHYVKHTLTRDPAPLSYPAINGYAFDKLSQDKPIFLSRLIESGFPIELPKPLKIKVQIPLIDSLKKPKHIALAMRLFHLKSFLNSILTLIVNDTLAYSRRMEAKDPHVKYIFLNLVINRAQVLKWMELNQAHIAAHKGALLHENFYNIIFHSFLNKSKQKDIDDAYLELEGIIKDMRFEKSIYLNTLADHIHRTTINACCNGLVLQLNKLFQLSKCFKDYYAYLIHYEFQPLIDLISRDTDDSIQTQLLDTITQYIKPPLYFKKIQEHSFPLELSSHSGNSFELLSKLLNKEPLIDSFLRTALLDPQNTTELIRNHHYLYFFFTRNHTLMWRRLQIVMNSLELIQHDLPNDILGMIHEIRQGPGHRHPIRLIFGSTVILDEPPKTGQFFEQPSFTNYREMLDELLDKIYSEHEQDLKSYISL